MKPQRIASVTAGLVFAVAVALGLSLGLPEPMHLPPAWQLIELALANPAKTVALFPSRRVAAAPTPRPWPRALQNPPDTVRWHDEPLSLSQFLQRTETRALVLIKDGALTYEWYAPGFEPPRLLPSYSVAKSVLSLLVGQAMAQGKLHEHTRLVDVVPELDALPGGDPAYREITVRHLLDMQSGVAVAERYFVISDVARMFATTDQWAFARDHRRLFFAPGADASYRSVDAMLLGLMLQRATGRSLSELLSQGLWQPLGAETDATWSLDRQDGTEKAFCCLNATARDLARLGQLVLDQGRHDGQALVPATFIDRIMTERLHLGPWGYSTLWWYPLGPTEPPAAIGIYGQYIVLDPAHRGVAVKQSEYGAEQDEVETVKVLRALLAADSTSR